MNTKEQLKLIVLDANFYWTEQMFSACRSFADILLLRPRDHRVFFKQHSRYFVDWQPHLVSDNIWEQRICCPPGWLFHYWSVAELFFTHWIRQFQGTSPLIFVFCYPYYHTIARRLNAFSIYYSMDDYAEYWPGRERQTTVTEFKAVQTADLTVCVAHYRRSYLQELCPNEAQKIVHIPHGCSTRFMPWELRPKPCSLPPELAHIERPVAGYIGALNQRFDFHFLAQVAEELPHVRFVLGGDPPQPGDGDIEWWQGVERIRQLPNVHLIGRVPHDRIGDHLQAFDCLLMVYTKSNFNTNSCPMKLWDYMGTARPIIANDAVPEVRLWQQLICVTETPQDFAANLQFVLANPNWKSGERFDVARENTWEKQAQKLYEIIREKTVNI